MGATKNRSISNTELFSRYGAAIYGMLMRRLGCAKLSEEILLKTFLSVKTNDCKANDYFRKLLAVSMSMVAGGNTRSSVKTISEENNFEGSLGNMGLSAEDRNLLGLAIRKDLSAFRKG